MSACRPYGMKHDLIMHSDFVKGLADGVQAAVSDQLNALDIQTNGHSLLVADPASTASAIGQAIAVHALTAAEVIAVGSANGAVIEQGLHIVNGADTRGMKSDGSEIQEQSGQFQRVSLATVWEVRTEQQDKVTNTVNDWLRSADSGTGVVREMKEDRQVRDKGRVHTKVSCEHAFQGLERWRHEQFGAR